jgi:ribosomal protein L1
VNLKLDPKLPCANSKTVKVAVVAATATSASAAAGTADHFATGELILIQTALATARPLLVAQATCDKQGAVVGTGLSLEPSPSTPADLCALPYAKEKAPQCQ